MLFTLAYNVNIVFGYFLKKICDQDFSKIAQCGHTVQIEAKFEQLTEFELV